MTVTVVAHIPQIKKNEFELLTRRARNDGMNISIRINDWLFNYMLSKRAQYP